MGFLSTCTPSQMTRQAFVEHFKDLYEHSPWVAEAVFDKGLSKDLDHAGPLLAVFQETMLAATQAQQLTLICAHPHLACKAAIRGTLTSSYTA